MDRLDLRILKTLLVNNGVPPGVPILRKSFRSMGMSLESTRGRFARIFGTFCVLFCVVGGTSFLILAWTSLQNFQLPALAVYGLFFLGFGEAILRLRGKEGLIQSAIPQ